MANCGEDRISELPVHIIHQILCCSSLYVKEAARSCILSKRWYYCWSSRPNLIFHQSQNYNTNYTYIAPEKFVKLVDQSLRSHVEQNLHLEQLILAYSDPKVVSYMDTWIELAVKLNVTVLGIHPSFLCPYSLPDVIYDAKNLTALRLSKCKFEFDISTTRIRFYCLEDLCLYNVHASDAQLKRVIDRCPSIKNLRLLSCKGVSKLHVFGLQHLKYLAASCTKFDSVIVQAPNLRCFRYVEGTENSLICEIAILDGYNTLQTLELKGASITDQQFRDVSYKLSNISNLNLTRCYKLKNIEMQSEKLKNFTLSELKSLEKVNIQAPNLLKFTLSQMTNLENATIQAPKLLGFDFEGDKMPFSSMDPSSLERARLNFSSPSTIISNFGSVDSSWYTNLHHFVRKFNYSKGLILVIFCRKSNSILIYDNPREIIIPPSHDVEIFIAPILSDESIIRKLMLCRPRIMSILPCTNNKVLEVLSALKRCTQKQKCGKECPFNTELFHNHHKLKEVIRCAGVTIEKGRASIWYSWLKSTSLIDQVTSFMLTWK